MALRLEYSSVRVVVAALSLFSMCCFISCNSASNRVDTDKKLQKNEVSSEGGGRDNTQYLYRLQMKSRAAMSETQVMMDMTLASMLAVEKRRVSDKEISLAFRLIEPEVSFTNGEDEVFKEETAALDEPFLASYVEGVLDKFRVSPDASRLSQTVRQSVAAAFQYVRRDVNQEPRRTRERDTTGFYTAEYRSGPSKGTLLKRKIGYEKPSDPKRPADIALSQVKMTVVASETTLKFGEDGLKALSSKETLSATIAEAAPIVSENELTLVLDKTTPAKEGPWQTLASLPDFFTSAPPAPRAFPSPAMETARIAGRSFDDILAALEAGKADAVVVPTDTDNTEERERLRLNADAFPALIAYFRLHPDTIERAVRMIRDGSPLTIRLLDGLAAASTSASQSALSKIVLDKTLPLEIRASGAHSLIRAHDPSDEALRTLTALLKEKPLRQHGLLGLGTMVRRLREKGEIQKADGIAPVILDELKNADDRSQRILALRAVANSGHAEAFEAVEPFFDDADPSVQGAAVEAIRLMSHPAVDDIIIAKLDGADRTFVRHAALSAAKTRAPSSALVDAVGKTAVDGADSGSRKKAVMLLAKWHRELPDKAKPFLEKVVAKEDELPVIKTLAERALAR